MESVKFSISAVLPTVGTLLLLVGAALNWAFQKRWFNLVQLLGLGLWVLPMVLRFAAPQMIGAYSSLSSRLLGIGATLGFVVFTLGYLAMGIDKRNSQPATPTDR